MNGYATRPYQATHSGAGQGRIKWGTRAIAALGIVAMLAGCSAPMVGPSAAPVAPLSEAPAAEQASSAGSSSSNMSSQALYVGPDQPADMYFEDYGVRGFVDASEDALSTFSVDVDTGAYSVARSYIQDGIIPPPDAVRTEEFLNYFNYNYPLPDEGNAFNIVVDGAPSPFDADEHRLMRVGIQAFDVDAEDRPDARLTFVIDVSGSMDQENRLGLAKRALYLLVDALRPTDEVAIVVYGDTASEVLRMTPVEEKADILAAINRLQPQGSTNAAAGIELGYEVAADAMARDDNESDMVNRVILLSDGVANVGPTGPDDILDLIKREAEEGIGMVTVGFGMGNYNDTLMEQLADDGDGFYAYVDTLEEAEKVFVRDLTSTLLTVAKNAKIQVEFNDEVVDEYRLSGYENRKVKDDDFRDDDVDAGEVGAGHSVTALYEIEFKENGPEGFDPDEVIATVRLRWEEPGTGEVIEIDQPFTIGELRDTFEDAPLNLQLAVSVAEFAEVLRQTEYAEDTWLGDVAEEVERINDELADDGGDADDEVRELENLIYLVVGMMPPAPESLED